MLVGEDLRYAEATIRRFTSCMQGAIRATVSTAFAVDLRVALAQLASPSLLPVREERADMSWDYLGCLFGVPTYIVDDQEESVIFGYPDANGQRASNSNP